MNLLSIRKYFAVLVALSLMGYPVELAALPVVDGAAEGAEASSAIAESAVPAPSAPDTFAASKPTTMNMGGISLPRSPITMDFQDADVRDILRLLALKSGLNVIYGADVMGALTLHLDRVPFDQAFQTVLTLKGLVALPMGPRVIRVVSSTALTTEQSQAATFTRVFRLNYASADDMKRPVDAIRSAAGRKGVSTVDTKTNSLIITDTQEGLKEVEDLIPILDKKPQQVDIESKIVEVTLDNETQTGISWQYAANSGQNDVYKIGGSKGDSGVTTGPGVLPSPAGATFLTPLGPSGTFGSQGKGTGVDLNPITAVGLSFLTKQGTYLLSAQISALAQQNRVKVLSTPHVVTTNNEEAKINVADKIPYTVSTLSQGVSQTSVQFIEAGVKLTVKPTVNADRRITLKVRPEVSNPSGTALPNLPPTVNTRNAETTVVLRDGETIAIGGLIKEQTTKAVSGIPILMSIPILGYLFKSTDDRKTRTELIVFLTPKIAAE